MPKLPWVVMTQRWILIPFLALVVLVAIGLGVFYGAYSGSRAPNYGVFSDVESLTSGELVSHKVSSLAVR